MKVIIRCDACARQRPAMGAAPMLGRVDRSNPPGRVTTFQRRSRRPEGSRKPATEPATDWPRYALSLVEGKVAHLSCRVCSHAPRVKVGKLRALASEAAERGDDAVLV